MTQSARVSCLFLFGTILVTLMLSCAESGQPADDSDPGRQSVSSALITTPGVLNQFVTKGDRTALFSELADKPAFVAPGGPGPTITLDDTVRYQAVEGFGFTLTEGSAEVIGALASDAQRTLLEDLFHPQKGIGISVVRISIGASDLSSSTYTYQELRDYPASTPPIGSTITLQGATNSQFVSSENGVTPMRCNRASASSWETFRVVDAGGGTIALQAHSNGKYVSATSPLYANSSTLGVAQKFAWLSPRPGQVQLRSISSGQFVSSENGTTDMTCNRSAASGWETFNVRAATFSLSGPDQTYTIPILKKALAINPSLKVLATPWTAPTWMKSRPVWVGESLQRAYYPAYAEYFRGYLDAMAAQGVAIWAITPQNEPKYGGNNPSMLMSAAEQASFLRDHLGPTLRRAGYGTKILAYDHNCDDVTFPNTVSRDAGAYVDGSAFHLYAGLISALSAVRASTGKDVYLTEQWTEAPGDFAGDLAWHTDNITIGASNNWARAILEWNLATDASMGPHTPGGCPKCQGALTVKDGGYIRNVSYFIIAHASKHVRPGAVRIGATSSSASLVSTAFVNDRSVGGAKVAIVLNKSMSAQKFNLVYRGSSAPATLTAGSVGTYVFY